MTSAQEFNTIVLAADRGVSDPVAKATGSPCKALASVHGQPMLERVIQSLQQSHHIESIVVVGPSQDIVENNPILTTILNQENITWIPNGPTPCTSAQLAFEELPDSKPVLITTADHALLNPEIIDFFCQQSIQQQADAVVGLATADTVINKYPDVGRTQWRFKDNRYCSCNLFAITSQQGQHLIEFWKQVENDRKKPHRIISKLGWVTVLRFLTRQISLDQALQQLSDRLSISIRPVLLPFAEAAIDVDSERDLRLVERILSG